MPLNLNALRSFHAVVQAGSVSGAAKTQFVSQPALSKAIRELEKQTGLTLLERTARGVVLTEPGRTLADYAQALFAIESEAEAALDSFRALETGSLRIGASTTISTYVLPRMIADLRREHPGLRISVHRENTRTVVEMLCAYELDVALVEGPPHDERVKARVWREDELICICAPDHPLANREQVWPMELADFDWITREEGSGTREVMEMALRSFGLPPQNALVMGGAELLKQSVAAGLGISFLSRLAAADQLALGRLKVVPIAELELRRPFYWLELVGRPTSPAVKVIERKLFDRV